MTDTFFVASPGVLGLGQTSPGIKWSWGVNMPEASAAEYETMCGEGALHGSRRDPCLAVPEEPGFGKYHYFHGLPEADELYYRRTFMGRRDLWMRLSGLLTDEIHLQVNATYARYVTHRFMNLHSPGYVLTDVVAWALLRAGYAPVHCSGFSAPDGTVLVLAPPNTGKTLTTMMACMDMGAGYLAEDVAITDGSRSLLSHGRAPSATTITSITVAEPVSLNRLTKIFPPAELLPVAKSSRIDDLLNDSSILTSAPVTHVAVLERHENEG